MNEETEIALTRAARMLIQAALQITGSRLVLAALAMRSALLWIEYAIAENESNEVWEGYERLIEPHYRASVAWCEDLWKPVQLNSKGGDA